MEQILTLDAETDGLWGKPFSIGAILYNENGGEQERFYACLPKSSVKNTWVIENVLPQLPDEATHTDLDNMLKNFALFYMRNKKATVIWHMGHVVEAGLFRLLVKGGYIGEWDAPYTPIEISSILLMIGEDPSSVDNYAGKNNLTVPNFDGGTHNPLYDCAVTAEVFYHILRQK